MDLPHHLIEVQILPYLPLLDIFRYQRVCRRWKDRLNHLSFWKVVIKERFFLLRWDEYFGPTFITSEIPVLFQHCARFIQRLDRYFGRHTKLWFGIDLYDVWTPEILHLIEIVTSIPIQQMDQDMELDLLISSVDDGYQVDSTIGARCRIVPLSSDHLIALLLILFKSCWRPFRYCFDEEPLGIELDDSLMSIQSSLVQSKYNRIVQRKRFGGTVRVYLQRAEADKDVM